MITQKDLEDLQKALEANLHSFTADRIWYTPQVEVESMPPTSLHLHEWTEYVGFRESYTFCKICDKKKR